MKGKVHAMPDNMRSPMGRRGIRSLFLLMLAWLVAVPAPCVAGVPVVTPAEVTDVTPASFTLIWKSSEPANGSLLLFDADCVTPVISPILSGESSDRSGFIRVTAAGLAANSSYCYKTVTVSKDTSETTLYPATPATVKTETSILRSMAVAGKNVPFANDLLAVPPTYLATGADSQDGFLIVLNMLDGKGNSPLSLLLGTAPAKNYFNMNNLFAPTVGQSINLTGGERVKISERHGNLGCQSIERFRKVPADAEITRKNSFSSCISPYDIDCSGTISILDILRVVRGVGSATGGSCFNSDLDVNSDGSVDLTDVNAVAGGFDATLP